MTPARSILHPCRTLTALLVTAFLTGLPAWAAERSGFKVKRGTNISHWLSQSSNRGAERRNWFSKEDLAFLARLGFDHLRILLSFHFYEPFLLTHHTAGWTRIGGYKGPVHYPGQTVDETDLAGVPDSLAQEIRRRNGKWDRARIMASIAKPLALAQKTGRPLYCGEWGCLPAVSRESRLAWYRDMVSVLNEQGIGWATWDYKGGFGLRKRDGNPDQELIDILTGR